MFERERNLYAYNLEYTRRLVDGLDDAEIAQIPSPGINPPIWILGHLAICTDYVLSTCGLPMALPEAWHRSFGPGSMPLAEGSVRPGVAELMNALTAGHERALQAATQLDPDRLAEKHTLGMELIRKTLPTVGDLIAHLLSTHEAGHLGQFSTWRRLKGLPQTAGFEL
ncbi:DinB family protein [Isosphaeraceae bacterium EP7]